VLPELTRISNGRESWTAGEQIPRHLHNQPYAAVVLTGGYEECGSRGRFRVAAGGVLVHAAFDAHLDRFSAKGAQILNLVLPDSLPGWDFGLVEDPDAIVRAAERDPVEAYQALRAQLRAVRPGLSDWPDALARHLFEDPSGRLDEWARAQGLSRETVSRGFGKVFGITPACFRAEARARRALELLAVSPADRQSLAAVAAAVGFADQAHMTRAVRAMTGLPPGAWRRSIRFKTARVPAG
jgi:AraC-like DNA-binding protein